MPNKKTRLSVGEYLIEALSKKGVDHIFGVPGDFILGLHVIGDERGTRMVNCTREEAATYAADGFAREKGLGAVAVTYGVGIHLVEREGFAEAPVLQAALQRHGWHRLLSREQFACGDWQLDQPLLAPAAAALPGDGALEAARLLASLGDELTAKASVANR